MEPSAVAQQKAHRASRTKKKKSTSSGTGGKKNAVAKPGAFSRRIRLAADRSEKRAPNPNIPLEGATADAAPRLVAVVGPSGVGKTTIIRNLVKHYSKRNIPTVTGPITLVAGRKKRLTFLEVGPDLPSMIDAAKIADLVLLVIDASYGFEMETFEFLNIAAVHGMPKIIAVLTHLDSIADGSQARRAKKTLKDRIWGELYNGAKVFYLSGITTTGDYLSREILNLARFISVSKQPFLRWRADHPYLLADRVEDITAKSLPDSADRTVAIYGYIRGAPVRPKAGEWQIHLAGVSDLIADNVEALPDPCPPPEVKPAKASQSQGSGAQKKPRKLSERERVVHAPMAPEIDGISYDRDAIYINLATDNVRFSDKSTLIADSKIGDTGATDGSDSILHEDSSDGEGEKMVKSLQRSEGAAVDESLKKSQLQLVTGGKRILSERFASGRTRRPAHFDDEEDGDGRNSDSDESADESESDGAENQENGQISLSVAKVTQKDLTPKSVDDDGDEDGDDDSSDDDDEDDDSDDDDNGNDDVHSDFDANSDDDNGNNDQDEALAQRWKEQMLENAAKRIKSSVSTSKALTKLIYGKDADGSYTRKHELRADVVNGDESNSNEGASEDDGDELFTRRRPRAGTDGAGLWSLPEGVAEDITRLLPNAVRDWVSNEFKCAKLRRARWGTGYRETLKAAERENGENSDDESVDGDFEDLETGEVHHGRHGERLAPDSGAKADDVEESGSDLEAIRKEKVRQKAKFNSQWDNRGGKNGEDSESDEAGGKDEDGRDVKSRKAMRGEEERVVDPRKEERDRLDRVRQEEMDGLGSEALVELQGYLPGQYIRVELKNVPVEFVKYFNPNHPTILGGLQAQDDDGKMFLRGRIRRHRFKRGVLKSSDPVILSIGWRRFQSMPVYDTEDAGGRRRFLKYTPEFLHCNATFWGPGVSPGAGIVMCQTLGRDRAGFRVAGTGLVTEVSATCNVMKKLKLIGEPVKIHKNTAFIKGMFSSETEVSKFIGASIRTVSGIRGTIKKAISEIAQRGSLDTAVAKSPAGTYRAGFEDRILMSDLVFLRTWVPVEAAKFCSVAANLLEKDGRSESASWRMRTIREVRQAKGMAIPLEKDSLYKDIERGAPMFAPFKLSRKLESGLPFASKPKDFSAKKKVKNIPERKAAVQQERAVVLDEKEKQEHRLLQAVYTIRNDRNKRRKEAHKKRLDVKKREWAREAEKHEMTSRERHKRKFALAGAREARDAKRSRHNEED